MLCGGTAQTPVCNPTNPLLKWRFSVGLGSSESLKILHLRQPPRWWCCRPRDWTHISCIGRWIHYHWAIREALKGCVKKESEVSQLCPALCDPVDCSPLGSSVHGILQARILEWVTISFCRGSSQCRDGTQTPALQADDLPSEPPGKP